MPLFHRHGCPAAQFGNLAFQSPDACLPRITVNHLMQGAIRNPQLGTGQAALANLFGDQMLLGNGKFSLMCIAGQLHHIHAVIQRRRNGRHIVGRGNKENLAQVVWDLQVVIVELPVLLPIEHLQQCR